MNNAVLYGKTMKNPELLAKLSDLSLGDRIIFVEDKNSLKTAFLCEFADLIAFSATDAELDAMIKPLLDVGWKSFRVCVLDIADGQNTVKCYICYKNSWADIFSDILPYKKYTIDELISFIAKKRAKIKQNRLLAKLKKFLVKVGIYSNLLGFDYLTTAVLETVRDRRLLYSMTTKLYPLIAEKYSTSPKNVERNIRNAIEVGYNRGKLFKEANALGGNFTVNEKPSNSEFIAFLADMLLD